MSAVQPKRSFQSSRTVSQAGDVPAASSSDPTAAEKSHNVAVANDVEAAAPAKPALVGFFDPSIAVKRKLYIKNYFIYASMLVILMWGLLSLYWASLAYTSDTDKTKALNVWVVDFDGGIVGQTLLEGVAASLAISDKNATLGWEVRDGNGMSEQDIIDGLVDEKYWGAIIVHNGASAASLAALSSGTSPSSAGITAYIESGRSELATPNYIQPYLSALLHPITLKASANITATFLKQNSNGGNQVVTALSSFAQTGAKNLVDFEFNDVRPFSKPVAGAVTVVGMILLCIFSFILTIANSALRPILAPHLKLHHYLIMRVVFPALAYIPLSMTFSLISLSFHINFEGKYTENGRGFWLFWVVSWLLMVGLGLATEFAITFLTIRFAPFFLLTLIITNVSTTEFPMPLLPGVFRYGKAWQFFNASQAYRTIMFDTKSHLRANIPALIVWILLSITTVSLATIFMERRGKSAPGGH